MEKSFRKKIDVNNGKVFYSRSEGYCIFHSIQYDILDRNNKLEKILKFNMWDDFSFSGYIFSDKQERIVEFEIDKQNPLYIPIAKFLGDEETFLIEDDETRYK